MKHEPIDLMELYVKGTPEKWNHFLSKCLAARDMDTLLTTRYRMQAGMAELAKKKLNTDEMCNWFIRAQKSIETTCRQIWRLKTPNPCDNPKQAMNFLHAKSEKKKRDEELELIFKRTSF